MGCSSGKQLGIFAVTLAAIRLGLAPAPGNASMTKVFGVSIVAGIGFTVALFIAGLAFPGDPHLLDEAKFGIICGSFASGIAGCALLAFTRPLAPSDGVNEGTPNAVGGG